MSQPQVINRILEGMEEYIEQCAKDASTYFTKYDLCHEFFEGISMTMTVDICRMLYRDMITELFQHKRQIIIKYGLFANMMPVQKNDRVVFIVKLGQCFPDRS